MSVKMSWKPPPEKKICKKKELSLTVHVVYHHIKFKLFELFHIYFIICLICFHACFLFAFPPSFRHCEDRCIKPTGPFDVSYIVDILNTAGRDHILVKTSILYACLTDDFPSHHFLTHCSLLFLWFFFLPIKTLKPCLMIYVVG